MTLIGRQNERLLIKKAIDSNRAELGIVYGRRRVGKSTLLKELIRPQDDYFFEGLQNLPEQDQIDHFIDELAKQGQHLRIQAHTWKDAFDYFSTLIQKGKHYVVFDELPWMAGNRTELVSLIKFYWDNYWKKNPKLTLILCGSIAQFMVNHVVHSQALHNRKTFEIKLEPLTAPEAKSFFRKDNSPFEVMKYLIVFGGIPKYLEQIDPKISFAANMDHLCFNKNGFFINEFETIFKEQFKVTRVYEKIVRQLSKKSYPMNDLSRALHLPPSGGFNLYLENLERADFIKRFRSFSFAGESTRTQRIYLWDEWLKFYFTYIQPHLKIIQKNTKPGLFDKLTSKSFEIYCGLGFEQLCMKNFTTLLKGLEIDLHNIKNFGPFFRQAPRNKENFESGLQIDLLIEQRGGLLTLVECKYSSNPIGKGIISQIERKIQFLKPPRRYSVQKMLIAPGGVSADLESSDYFHKILGLEAVVA